MKLYEVTTQITTREAFQHQLDIDEGPKHNEKFVIASNTEREALEWFHSNVPIKELDNYNITCEEI